MYYEIYDTIAKATDYVGTPREHFEFLAPFHIRFLGQNSTHELKFTQNGWNCDCLSFARWRKAQLPGYSNFCAHVVAIEKLIRKSMLYEILGWQEQ